jgi:hypothetical protein
MFKAVLILINQINYYLFTDRAINLARKKQALNSRSMTTIKHILANGSLVGYLLTMRGANNRLFGSYEQ